MEIGNCARVLAPKRPNHHLDIAPLESSGRFHAMVAIQYNEVHRDSTRVTLAIDSQARSERVHVVGAY